MDNPLALLLPPDIREATDQAQFERVEEIVESCRDRDDELRDLRRQNESEPASREGPWPGSCDLEDSISRELHTTLLAPARQSIRYPYYLIDPVDPADEDAARKVESYFNPRLRQCGFKAAIDKVIYTALESRYAPLVISYKTVFQRVRELWKEDLDGGEVVRPEEQQPDRSYRDKMVLNKGALLYDGLHFRTPQPWNVYPYPSGATCFSADDDEGAIAVIERLFYTREDLMLGVKTQGFDPDVVRSMCRQGPPRMTDEAREELLDRDGIQAQSTDGFYECYQILGRLPYITDAQGYLETPDELLHEDFVWILCPGCNAVLKRAFSADPIRPYVRFVAYDVPGSFLGHGILSLIRPLQEEMTGTLRLAFDQMNLAASAPFMVPESHLNRFGDVVFGPGKTIPLPTGMAELKQVLVDHAGPQQALAFLEFLYGRAMQIGSAQGVNSNMEGKVRKQAEVEFTQQMLATKFDLVTDNFKRGMEDSAQVMLSMLLQYTSGEDTVYAERRAVTVTQQELSRRFRFLAQVSSDNVNERARVERDLNLYRVVTASPIHQMRLMAGDLSGEYHMMRRLVEHMGERDPETVLGPVPEPVMPGMGTGIPGAQMGGGMAAEGGMNPAAPQILQASQAAGQAAAAAMGEGANRNGKG